MTDLADEKLIELVTHEQRGLRRTLIAGFGALLLVVVMSAGLGVYYFFVAERLASDSDRLERRAFETRRLADDLANRMSDQEAAVRRAYSEVLDISDGTATADAGRDGLDLVEDFLKLGIRSLENERRLEQASGDIDPGPETDLYRATLALMQWERSGEELARGASELPERLSNAQALFRSAALENTLRIPANQGLAWIQFEIASSPQSNYRPADCQAMFDLTDKIDTPDALGPQPLYWRGQCARKLGRVERALQNYSLAVQQSQGLSDRDGVSAARRQAVRVLQMNAFHGLGTVLIAAADTDDSEPLTRARQLASEACVAGETEVVSGRTGLIHACLGKAISLRRELRQTANQISGTMENRSFVYLIDDDFEGAFRNAMEVERTGLFAWNELIRALVAPHVGEVDAARDARRNVSMFRPEQFAICEIRKLLKPKHFDEALEIFTQAHPDFELSCT